MLYFLLDATAYNIITFFGAVLAFALTFLFTLKLKDKLPTDIGRAFAVNAAAAKGKPRGAGIIFVIVFVVCILIFTPFCLETVFYCALLLLAMLAGYLDDASRAPWGEYKKGLIDLGISFLVTLVFAIYNGTGIFLPYTKTVWEVPMWLYLILGTVLVWASVNVTNCTDGVDGLSSTLSLITLGGFLALINKPVINGWLETSGIGNDFGPWIIMMMAVIAAYLMFNASPSILLMGDAGSRTIGVFFALAAMKSGAPLMFLVLCLVFILDGGLGLIKVSLLRFLKVKFMMNIRTPLHDHARKNKGWSDTHTVIRFCIINLAIIFIALWFI